MLLHLSTSLSLRKLCFLSTEVECFRTTFQQHKSPGEAEGNKNLCRLKIS